MHEILVRLRIKSDGGPGDVFDVVNHVLDAGVLQDAINGHDHDSTTWEMHVESAVAEWPDAANHDAHHQPDTHDAPQPCYPEDVATLREMLAEVRESLADAEQGIADRRAIAGYTWKKAQAERRIEALQTAIEALGGAL